MGRIYSQLGLFDKAVNLQEEALRQHRLTNNPAQLVSALSALAGTRRAQGEYQKSLSHGQEALALARSELGRAPATAEVLDIHGWTHKVLGQFDQAEPLLQESLAMRKSLAQERGRDNQQDLAVADSLHHLGMLRMDMADYSAALRYMEEALSIRRQLLGQEHPLVASSLNDLANFYLSDGDFKAAEPLLRRALAMREKMLVPKHPDIMTTKTDLATTLGMMGKYVEVEPLLRETVAFNREYLGMDHLDTALTINNLGMILRILGRLDESESVYREALSLLEVAGGLEHPGTSACSSNLGGLLAEKGEYEEAENLLRRALTTRQKVFGPKHPAVARVISNLALMLIFKGDYEVAEKVLRDAMDIWEFRKKETEAMGKGLLHQALLHQVRGEFGEAEAAFRRALAIRRKLLAPENIYIAETATYLADLLAMKHQYSEAETLLAEAMSICRGLNGEDHLSGVNYFCPSTTIKFTVPMFVGSSRLRQCGTVLVLVV